MISSIAMTSIPTTQNLPTPSKKAAKNFKPWNYTSTEDVSVVHTQFYQRVAEIGTKGPVATEERLQKLEYVVKVLNSKNENLETTIKLQNSLIFELDSTIKKDRSRLIESLRDIGIAVVDLSFVKESLTSIITALSSHH